MANLDTLSAQEIARGVAEGSFSAKEVAQAALDACVQRDREVDAFLEITYDLALERAEAVDAARAKGEPL